MSQTTDTTTDRRADAHQVRPFTGAEFLDSLHDSREVWIYGERVKLEIRADFFNLFNHPLWNVLPGATASTTSITNPNFGQITSTGVTVAGINDPMARVIQLAARFIF